MLLPDVELKVEWLPFFLDPTLPPAPVSKRDWYNGRYGEERVKSMESRMQATAASEGIQIVYDGFTSNTMPAHRLITWAKASGKQDTLVTKIFEQYFGNGKAPCDTEMLAEAAAQAGLDKAEAEAFLESDDLKADVATEAERVKRSFGVSGVPFFVVHADGSPDLPIGVSGAQEPETLVQIVREAIKDADAK
eukprot:m.449308 g.449308  ORF g.449308 m.449308 type:complete len:192 (-) comp19800_c0_seq1:175-750(-)